MPWIGKYLIWVGSLCFPELRRPWKLELTVKAGKNFEVWSWKANLIKQNLSSSSPCAEKQNFQHFWRVSLNVAVLKSHLSFRNLEASSSTLLDLKSTYLQDQCDQIVWFIAIWATFIDIWRFFLVTLVSGHVTCFNQSEQSCQVRGTKIWE